MYHINVLFKASLGGVSFSALVALKFFDSLVPLHVSIIVALIVEGFSTDLTVHPLVFYPLKLFWAYCPLLDFMLDLMSSETRGTCKMLTALLTVERLLPRVSSQVVCKLRPADESFSTLLTLERFLCSMMLKVVPL